MDQFKFQILRIRKTDGARDIKGYADIVVGPVTIFGVKIIENEDGVFCAMPSEKFFSKPAGRSLNRAVVHLEEDLRLRVYEAILEEWNRMTSLKFKDEGGH